MEFVNEYTLNVDIKRAMSSIVPTFKQGDSARLKFKIFDNGKNYNLSKFARAEITFKLPNNEIIIGSPTLQDGLIVYDFTGIEMERVGNVTAILSIFATDDTVVSIRPFRLFIYDTMKAANLSYTALLQELIAETQVVEVNALGVISDMNDTREALEQDATTYKTTLVQDVASYKSEVNNFNAQRTHKKDWNTTVQYVTNNEVLYNGSSWRALRNNKGVIPVEGLDWTMIARKGADGNGTTEVHKEKFIATQGQMVFTLQNRYDQFQNRATVFVNGVQQFTPQNYEEISSTAIAFHEGLPSGYIVEVTYFSEAVPMTDDVRSVVTTHTNEINKFNNQGIYEERFIATANQTIFTLQTTTYEPLQHKIEVFIEGIKQDSGDNFTETSNTTITLSEGVPAGTEVVVKYYGKKIPITTDVESTLNNYSNDITSLSTKMINVTEQLAHKANQSTTDDLQTQVDNLVLGSGSETESYAEILQARDKYSTLNGRLSKQQYDIEWGKDQLSPDTKGGILEGYYGSSDGLLKTGTNWYNYTIETKGDKVFIVEHPTISNLQLRMVRFTSGGVFLDSTVVSNGEIIVPDNCEKFALNIQLEGSSPSVSSFTYFTDLVDVQNLVIRKKEYPLIKNMNSLMELPTYDETSLNINLQEGYYGSGDGLLKTGTNWCYYYVEVNSSKTFRVINPNGGQVRLVMLNNGALLESRMIDVNANFEVIDACTHFSINIPLNGASPTTTSTTYEDLNEFSISSYTIGDKKQTILEKVNLLESQINTSNNKTSYKEIKILMIGNSFSVDATQYLFQIAQSAGINIVVGCAYDSGQDIEGHWNKIQSGTGITSYLKWSKDGYTSNAGALVSDIIVDEDWDVITYQQVSGKSFDYSTFQPFLTDMHNYIKSSVTNHNTKFGFQMTWAYATGSTNLVNSGYADQMDMYNAIASAYLQALEEMDFDILIPSGTSVQNARTNSYLQAVGSDLSRDGYHLNMGIGRYIAALTVFGSLMAGYYKKDVFSDVTFFPTNDGGTRFLAYLAKIAVENALRNPFKVSQI